MWNDPKMTPVPRREVAPRSNQFLLPTTADGGVKTAVGTGVSFVVAIWVVFIVDTFIFQGALSNFGVQPREKIGLLGIVFAPFLHADLAHIVSNTVPAALFSGLIAFTSKRLFWQVTAIVAIMAGGLTWLIGGINTVHIGASGLVYGWLAFLIVRGFFNKSILQSVLGVMLAMSYGGFIWGVLPTNSGVSWESHFFGALGGVLAAVWLKRGRQ